VLIAFAAGVGVGIAVDAFSCGRAESQRVSKEDVNISSGPLMVKGTRRGRLAHVDALVPSASANAHDSASDAVETTASTEDAASTAVVEVMTDNSPAPSPEISAEHAARQARRAAARAAQEETRWDFLSTLNLDLLTDSQRKTHEMFLEAQKVRDEAAAEIRRLRAAGEEVPADLQSRLADAQSVLRADHEAEYRILREAAARAAGLDETAVRQLMEDLRSIDGVLTR